MFAHTFKVSLTAGTVALIAALSACATPDSASIDQPDRGPTDCQVVQQAMNRASQAQQEAIDKDQESKARAEADQELYEKNPKKYWRQKREEAIARGMDPEQAKRMYNVDRGAPINLGRYSDSQAAGDRAYVESFTIAAAELWPRVEDPDLKLALRELSQGTSQQANFRAITSICNM